MFIELVYFIQNYYSWLWTVLNLLSVIWAVWRKRQRNRSEVVASGSRRTRFVVRSPDLVSLGSEPRARSTHCRLTGVFWPKPESQSRFNKCSYKLIFWDIPFPKRPFTSSAMSDIGLSSNILVFLLIFFYEYEQKFCLVSAFLRGFMCALLIVFWRWLVQTKKLAIASESCDVYGHYLWLSIINSVWVVKRLPAPFGKRKKKVWNIIFDHTYNE